MDEVGDATEIGGQDAGFSIDESTIGHTPVIELDLDVEPTVLAKVEWLNLRAQGHGGGSIKSRIARRMIDGARRRGDLPPPEGDTPVTVIEPSSGNTAVALSRVGRARGYDVELVVLDDTADEKLDAVRETGASVRFVAADLGYDATIERCEELIERHPERYYWLNQYDNPDNARAHATETAPEFWTQTDCRLTCVVAGVGTGGTVTGFARRLGDQLRVVGYEPASQGHEIEGLRFLREGEHPHVGVYDRSLLDDRRFVSTESAYRRARELRDRYADRQLRIVDPGQYDPETVRDALRVDGEFLVGPSSGASAELVSDLVADGTLDADDTVGLLLCDRGDRYASSLWADVL